MIRGTSIIITARPKKPAAKPKARAPQRSCHLCGKSFGPNARSEAKRAPFDPTVYVHRRPCTLTPVWTAKTSLGDAG